jgi:hypothetical protein
MLLPTVMGLSMAATGQTNAYQLQASDYAAKIAAALAAKDYWTASAATNRLRSCGVTSIVVGGSATSLSDIDDIIAKLKAGDGAALDGLTGGDASFLVGAIDQAEVNCETTVEASLVANDTVNPSST